MTAGRPTSRRSWPRAVAEGAAAGVAGALVTVTLLSLPLFGLASILEPRRGTGRSFIQTGLTVVVLPSALVVGLAVAVVAGRWRRRGGRLPD